VRFGEVSGRLISSALNRAVLKRTALQSGTFRAPEISRPETSLWLSPLEASLRLEVREADGAIRVGAAEGGVGIFDVDQHVQRFVAERARGRER
jgi:hypothetical protein